MSFAYTRANLFGVCIQWPYLLLLYAYDSVCIAGYQKATKEIQNLLSMEHDIGILKNLVGQTSSSRGTAFYAALSRSQFTLHIVKERAQHVHVNPFWP